MYGPLTIHERVDVAGALGAWATSRAAGGKQEFEKFIPKWDRSETASRPSQSTESMIAAMRSIQSRKRGQSK